MTPTASRACILALCSLATSAQAATCEARASGPPPAVVELYTSEGCSSCPPADRWLSRLKGRDDVIALAFHVNYWDRLGWPDRFASAANTERQHRLSQSSGASYVYTPQVLHNGRDLRDWRGATPTRLPASPISLALQREGQAVSAQVGPAGKRLAGYWAVLEDGHESRVRAGENAGETLKHDHVVTQYQPVESWDGREGRQFKLTLAPASAQARRIAFIVTDGASQRPLQALALAC